MGLGEWKSPLDSQVVWILKKTHSSINYYFLSPYNCEFPNVTCLTLVYNFNNSKKFTFYGTHKLTWCSFYLFFFFLFFFFSFNPQYLNSPNPVKKKKKKPNVKRIKKKKKKKIIEKPSTNLAWKKRRRRRRQRVLERAKGLTGFDYSLTVSPLNMCVFTKMSS